MVEHCEVESRKHFVYPRVFEPPADPAISMRLGECGHAMRVALDHLAYRLACVVHGQDPPPNEGDAAFPIYEAKGKTPGKQRFDGAVGGMIAPKQLIPSGLYAALEGLQPYHGGDHKWLATLQDLDNLAKHRTLPIVAGIAQITEFRVEHARVTHFEEPAVGPLKEGAPVVVYTPEPGTEVSMNFDFHASVAFADESPVAPGEVAIVVLIETRNVIRDRVLPALEPFLASGVSGAGHT